MFFGNQTNDGGYLLLSEQEAETIKQNDKIAAKYIYRFLGAEEFIHNLLRYCLWLVNSTSNDRINSPEIKKRVEKVKRTRLESKREATRKLAERP